MTELSADLLDYIFSFLVSDKETLVACSDDPVLSPIVERHLYYRVIVHIGNGEPDSNHAFKPDYLSSLVSKNPCILNYVRELQIQAGIYSRWPAADDPTAKQHLDEFAQTLVTFPNLECIMLMTPPGRYHWQWADVFRAALEDRLKLPTLKALHLVGSRDFPSSLLDNCKNIKHLSLSGNFTAANVQVCGQTLPQLKSLTFSIGNPLSPSLLAWVKLHINELQSMTCTLSYEGKFLLSELLEVCPPTLSELEIDMRKSDYCSERMITGEIFGGIYALKLSRIPPNLRQLTIRTMVAPRSPVDMEYWESWLPAAAGVILPWLPAAVRAIKPWLPAASRAIKPWLPAAAGAIEPCIQHLVLDVDLYDLSTFSELAEVDFSPLTILGVASLSIPRIDLYIHTGIFPSALTRAQLLSSLGDDEDVVRPIKEGVLVIHSEKTAP